MNDKLQDELAQKIKELEDRIEDDYESQKKHYAYETKSGKVVFSKSTQKLQREKAKNIFRYIFESPFRMFITSPVIYSIIFPILLLDIFVSIYQWICFPIYKIEKVRRRDHIVLDRHHLKYLNSIEKINCLYCGYINGFISYIGEIAGHTEQYFCPIKHAKRPKNAHAYYKNFIDYGNYQSYKEEVKELRIMLRKIDKKSHSEGKSSQED